MNLHGVLKNLSPVKKGRTASFLDGQVSDSTSRMRNVGFRGVQRKKLLEFSQSGTAVVPKDCQVKMSRQWHEMVKNSTKITASDKTFEMSDEVEDKPVTLSEVNKMEEYTRVTVIVKVLSKHDPRKL